jgi:hypothetical protein
VALIADLLSRVRLELGDNAAQFSTTLAGDGVTKSFYMTVKPVDALYLDVKINGVQQAQTTNFTVEENIGYIHFVTTPADGAVITITGTHYRYFTTGELTTFVNTAVLQHTDNRTDAFGSQITISSIPAVEEYPVALLATVEALWALATDAAFDINISAPDGVQIPRSQRFAQLSQIIAARKEQYRELCSALNVGLWRIEMGTLRRVSRTTNKLVPIYMAQEIDDSTKPERVYIENNLKGRTPVPDNVAPYDIILTQGDAWETEFDFPLDFSTNYTLNAQIRTYPESPTLVAQFTVTVLGTTVIGGVTYTRVKLSLTSDQTEDFPLKSFWDAQIRSDDGTFNETYVRGLVFANRQVTVDTNVSTATITAPTYTASTPPTTATIGTFYTYAFSATGPDPVFSIASGALPSGLSLSPFTGVLSGTPNVAGVYSFVVRVHDSGLTYTTAQNTYPVSGLYTDVSRSITVS